MAQSRPAITTRAARAAKGSMNPLRRRLATTTPPTRSAVTIPEGDVSTGMPEMQLRARENPNTRLNTKRHRKAGFRGADKGCRIGKFDALQAARLVQKREILPRQVGGESEGRTGKDGAQNEMHRKREEVDSSLAERADESRGADAQHGAAYVIELAEGDKVHERCP